MAAEDLILILGACEASDGQSLTLYEFTRAYSAGNTGGWGNPNPAIADVSSATVAVYLPKSATPVVINVFSTFPTTDETIPYPVTNVMLGLGATDPLPDGVYEFQYEVSGTFNGEPFTVGSALYKYFHRQADCCLSEKLLCIDPCELRCGQSSPMLDKVTQLRTLVCAAAENARFGMKNKAQALADFIEACCSCKDCNQ